MSFSDIFKPRREVLRKGGIEGVIDIENLRDEKRRTIESRPEDFFELTFPRVPTATMPIVVVGYL